MAKIVGPGSLIVDITAFASHFPVDGETVVAKNIRLGAGGKGSNQMTAAHRSGSDVRLISRMGDDVLGEAIKRHYEMDKMSMEYIDIVEGETTDSAVISIDTTNAQNRILVLLDANMKVSGADVLKAEKEFAGADIVLVQYETSVESILQAKALAKKYGKTFICNPAPFREMPLEFYQGIDYITPNETEAEYITGIKMDTMENIKLAAKKLLSMGVKNAIITLGVRGVYYTNGEEEMIVDGLKVDAVETTGAGDAFNGGFVTAIGEGKDMETALRFATCVAAISVTRCGSSPSMPYRHETEALYMQTYGEKYE